MHRFTNLIVALFLAAGLSACGGGYSGFIIPIESDLKPWVEPEAEELLGTDDDEDEDDGEDYEDYEDYEDATPAAAAVKPAPAKPAPAKVPAKPASKK